VIAWIIGGYLVSSVSAFLLLCAACALAGWADEKAGYD
jgi:hypothetical protein